MSFSIHNLTKEHKSLMIQTGTWKPACPVKFHRLKLLSVMHYNLEQKICTGHITILDNVANAVLSIFQHLFDIKFAIHSIIPIEQYYGIDQLSMNNNNSSGFNFRTIASSELLSLHSYGLAIDINPIQNPCIVISDPQTPEISPAAGCSFLNRASQRLGMVEPIVHVFEQFGFSQWGGKWSHPIDYHHFQVPRTEIHRYL